MTAASAERAVRSEFMAGAYQATGCCAHCGERGPLAGRSPRARVCIICFEFEFDCRHPSVRTLEARRR